MIEEIFKEIEAYETDEEYKQRISKEGEYIKVEVAE